MVQCQVDAVYQRADQRGGVQYKQVFAGGVAGARNRNLAKDPLNVARVWWMTSSPVMQPQQPVSAKIRLEVAQTNC